MEYSVAGGKLIHEKNQKQKISGHSPFKSMLYLARTGEVRAQHAGTKRSVK